MRISTSYNKIKKETNHYTVKLISQVNLCILIRILDGLFNLFEFYMAKDLHYSEIWFIVFASANHSCKYPLLMFS